MFLLLKIPAFQVCLLELVLVMYDFLCLYRMRVWMDRKKTHMI